MNSVILGLSLLLSIHTVYSEMSYEDMPYVNYRLLYDKQFNLTCESETFNISAMPPNRRPSTFYWVLPNGGYVGTDNSAPTETKRVSLGGTVGNYGMILTIKKADDDDYGIYNCLVEIDGKFKLAARKGINVDGPYYGDLLDKYRTNIIIGVCAGGGLLVLCIIGCLVYHLRYRMDEDEEEDEEKLNGRITEIHGHDNGGLDKADIPSSSVDRYEDITPEEKRPVSDSEIDTKL